jgi:hypothetical protein
MGSFSFNLPNGQKFELKGPPNLTFEQAKAIFDKQASTGSLVGLKPGDVLSAATQAASGLQEAQAALNQAQGKIIGALGPGIPGASGAIGQASAALAEAGGALNGALSNIPGVNGAAGPAVGELARTLNQSTNLVTSSIQNINNAISKVPVVDPINAADFVKTLPALGNISNMSQATVTASLASVKNITGQQVDTISNTGGVGQFGFDVAQLEKAGVVKPGTAALATSAAATVASVLKSPTTFTGKLGINNLGDLTTNPQLQSTIQQGLMATGLKELNTVGVPIKSLVASAQAGLSAIAAKSVPAATAYLKNLPIPGDASGAIQQGFNKIMREGAFASNLAETKLPPAFKAEVIPVPAENTTDRQTVDAASTRIVGNEKVPTLNYGPPEPASNQADIDAWVEKSFDFLNNHLNVVGRSYQAVNSKLAVLENRQSITQQEYDAVNNEYITARERYNARGPAIGREAIEIYQRLLPAQKRVIVGQPNSPTNLSNLIKQIVDLATQIKARLAQVALKIEGRGEGE